MTKGEVLACFVWVMIVLSTALPTPWDYNTLAVAFILALVGWYRGLRPTFPFKGR